VEFGVFDEGQKVIFKGDVSEASINWGNHTDPNGILIKGKSYIVENCVQHSWNTEVYLEGIEGEFNSVWFELNEVE
jgi:hypothetical protein